MQNFKNLAAATILDAVKEICGDPPVSAEEISSFLEYPPNPEMGDLAFPCFKLSKALRYSPQKISYMLADKTKTFS
jgi:arginyl-tRNA synthetase